MKKGKVEWLYSVSALMENGKIGVDYITTTTKLTKIDAQQMADAMKTNVAITYIGTIIRPPKGKEELLTYDYLTEEEKQKRLDNFTKEMQKKYGNSSKEAVQ